MELGANPDDVPKKRGTITKKELIKRYEALRKKRTKKQSMKRSMKKSKQLQKEKFQTTSTKDNVLADC